MVAMWQCNNVAMNWVGAFNREMKGTTAKK